MKKDHYTLEVITHKVGVARTEILEFISNELIVPADHENLLFDEEDLSRIKLICDLKETCSPNDEALQVILHLIDQIHYLQNQLKSK